MSEDRAEPRLASNPTASVVGYGRLLETNEERTLGAIRKDCYGFFDPTNAKQRKRNFKARGELSHVGS